MTGNNNADLRLWKEKKAFYHDNGNVHCGYLAEDAVFKAGDASIPVKRHKWTCFHENGMLHEAYLSGPMEYKAGDRTIWFGPGRGSDDGKDIYASSAGKIIAGRLLNDCPLWAGGCDMVFRKGTFLGLSDSGEIIGGSLAAPAGITAGKYRLTCSGSIGFKDGKIDLEEGVRLADDTKLIINGNSVTFQTGSRLKFTPDGNVKEGVIGKTAVFKNQGVEVILEKNNRILFLPDGRLNHEGLCFKSGDGRRLTIIEDLKELKKNRALIKTKARAAAKARGFLPGRGGLELLRAGRSLEEDIHKFGRCKDREIQYLESVRNVVGYAIIGLLLVYLVAYAIITFAASPGAKTPVNAFLPAPSMVFPGFIILYLVQSWLFDLFNKRVKKNADEAVQRTETCRAFEEYKSLAGRLFKKRFPELDNGKVELPDEYDITWLDEYSRLKSKKTPQLKLLDFIYRLDMMLSRWMNEIEKDSRWNVGTMSFQALNLMPWIVLGSAILGGALAGLSKRSLLWALAGAGIGLAVSVLIFVLIFALNRRLGNKGGKITRKRIYGETVGGAILGHCENGLLDRKGLYEIYSDCQAGLLQKACKSFKKDEYLECAKMLGISARNSLAADFERCVIREYYAAGHWKEGSSILLNLWDAEIWKNEVEKELLRSMAFFSIPRFYSITAIDPAGREVTLRDIFSGEISRITDIQLSGSGKTKAGTILYTSIIKTRYLNMQGGFAIAFPPGAEAIVKSKIKKWRIDMKNTRRIFPLLLKIQKQIGIYANMIYWKEGIRVCGYSNPILRPGPK